MGSKALRRLLSRIREDDGLVERLTKEVVRSTGLPDINESHEDMQDTIQVMLDSLVGMLSTEWADLS